MSLRRPGVQNLLPALSSDQVVLRKGLGGHAKQKHPSQVLLLGQPYPYLFCCQLWACYSNSGEHSGRSRFESHPSVLSTTESLVLPSTSVAWRAHYQGKAEDVREAWLEPCSGGLRGWFCEVWGQCNMNSERWRIRAPLFPAIVGSVLGAFLPSAERGNLYCTSSVLNAGGVKSAYSCRAEFLLSVWKKGNSHTAILSYASL